MSYPIVRVRGEALPAPFEGWDDREYASDTDALYVPSSFEFTDRMLHLKWSTDDAEEYAWINLDQIEWVTTTWSES